MAHYLYYCGLIQIFKILKEAGLSIQYIQNELQKVLVQNLSPKTFHEQLLFLLDHQLFPYISGSNNQMYFMVIRDELTNYFTERQDLAESVFFELWQSPKSVLQWLITCLLPIILDKKKQLTDQIRNIITLNHNPLPLEFLAFYLASSYNTLSILPVSDFLILAGSDEKYDRYVITLTMMYLRSEKVTSVLKDLLKILENDPSELVRSAVSRALKKVVPVKPYRSVSFG